MPTYPMKIISEAIEVEFDTPPRLEKSPSCPNRFTWREVTYQILETLEEWSDFNRRGRMSRNMRPAHITRASRDGSWGVGRFHFRVMVHTGQVFEIYYDRAPEDVDHRKGGWFLLGERKLSLDKEI